MILERYDGAGQVDHRQIGSRVACAGGVGGGGGRVCVLLFAIYFCRVCVCVAR